MRYILFLLICLIPLNAIADDVYERKVEIVCQQACAKKDCIIECYEREIIDPLKPIPQISKEPTDQVLTKSVLIPVVRFSIIVAQGIGTNAIYDVVKEYYLKHTGKIKMPDILLLKSH